MELQPAAANTLSEESTSLSAASRIAWTVLICATLYICYFSHLGALGFVGPDEPRYAWIARSMQETGDWVTPRLYGRPWFEKPVLYYWEAAACFKLFGVSEAVARLPSSISALLATLAMAWLGWRTYGGETARWFLLLLPTSAGMIGFSHAAATDMPFSGMLTVALVCAARVLEARGPGQAAFEATVPATGKRLWLVLFGFFLGLAALAKGPAAIVLMGGALLLWALVTHEWLRPLRLLRPIAIVAFCATALPWYVLCARRNPDFLRTFFIEHNFKRYLTPEFQHIQPFWYFGAVLLVALLPWTAILVWAAVSRGMRLWQTRSMSAMSWLLVCWSGFCLVFFSLSKSKLPGYILPALPAVALLLAFALSRLPNNPVAQRNLQLLTALLLLGIAAGLMRVPSVRAAGALAATGLAAAAAFHYTGLRSRGPVVSASGWTLAFYLLLTAGGRQVLDERLSARPALQRAEKSYAIYPGEASSYRLQRSAQYALSFYLHRELASWSPAKRTPGWVFTTRQGVAELRQFGIECSNGNVSPAPLVLVCVDEAQRTAGPPAGR